MFFLSLLTSVLSSEYLVCLLTRSCMLLFLGPGDLRTEDTANYTKVIEIKPAAPDLFFNGTFYLDSSDNFEPYLTELGVGYFLRQLAMLAFPIVTVKRLADLGCYDGKVFYFQFLSFGNLRLSL